MVGFFTHITPRRRFLRPLAFPDRSSERSKQGTVYRIGLRIVLGVPLDELGRVGNSDGLDRAVLRHALDDNAIPRFQNALTVERVDANRLSSKPSLGLSQSDAQLPVG